MKKISKKILNLLVVVTIVAMFKIVKAENNGNQTNHKEYNTEYSQLREDAESGILDVKIDDIPDTSYISSNPLKITRSSVNALPTTFNLIDYIPENMIVRNQLLRGGCWAFASLGTLESNLAMTDYYNGITDRKQYDFSEKHMEYSLSRYFLNDEINEFGLDRYAGTGGNFFTASTYLTNGLGAIDESSMPYDDDNVLIDISEIQNKTVTTQVFDTAIFPYHEVTDADIEDFKIKMKNHIINYGGLMVGIRSSSENSIHYNSQTAAYYCNDKSKCIPDHAVLIVGWIDDYDKSNFGRPDGEELIQPKNNGAWITKNSWGVNPEYDIDYLVKAYRGVYCQIGRYKANCTEENGWAQNPDSIPLEIMLKVIIEDNKYVLNEDGTKASKENGDKGFNYYSYEDVNIYNYVAGILKATNTVNYDKIYQHNYLGYNHIKHISTDDKIYISDIFKRNDASVKEYLTQVSIDASETYTTRVYVNPNGSEINENDLQLVELKAGDSETFDSGYHTLEFLKPIEITGEEFAIVLEIKGTRPKNVSIRTESKDATGKYSVVTIDGKSSYSTGLGNWQELTDIDTTIKAFTISEIEKLEIANPPQRTAYIEGQDFDTTGMVVNAIYKDSTKVEITDYKIEDGYNLQNGQTFVTITYQDKSITQDINVEKNTVESIVIEVPPSKTSYLEGDTFDATGMIVKAIYKNGNQIEITDYMIENGNGLEVGQNEVMIKYEGISTSQTISVREKMLKGIRIDNPPAKTNYIEGQKFDKLGMVVVAIYEDNTIKEITDYTIKNGDKLYKDQSEVIIYYNGFEFVQSISVEEAIIEKNVESITIKDLPNKRVYLQNQEVLDLTGGVITITYNDGSTEEIEMTSPNIVQSGFNNKNPGIITITLSYEAKSTEFTVEIRTADIEFEEPNEPDIPSVEIEPQNSNFEDAIGNILNINAFYYVNKQKENYVDIKIEIKDVEKNNINDSMEYYYYLSPSQDEGYIQDWIKIEESQNIEQDKIIFNINTNDLSNYEDISKSDTLYLYIKEVAIKGAKQSTFISEAMRLTSDVTIYEYIDDVLQENPKISDDDINDNPKTADLLFDIISLIIVLSLGVTVYYFNRHSKAKS